MRRTIDLLKEAAVSPHVQELSAAKPSECASQIAIATREAGIHGWYRLKVIAPEGLLQRVSVEALDEHNASICAFESTVPNKQFAGYIFLGLPIRIIRFRLDFDAIPKVKLIAKLRPISLIEYVWHSLRHQILQRPLTFFRYFFRPHDPFVLRFEFPRPQQFASQNELYQWWIANREAAAYEHLIDTPLLQTLERPSISILMTVCDPQPVYLRRAIESVLCQTTKNWQLCIADDASTNPEVRQILSNAGRSNERINVSFRDNRGGISAASNTALAKATAPFVVCLDHDDTLAPSAMETFGTFLGQRPNTRILYSDEDKIDQNDNRFLPYFKPNFSRELLYSSNYLNHLTAYHSDTMRRIGGWRSEYDGAQDYDANLRTIEVIDEGQIGHVPMILYHWRAIPGSAALDIGYKWYAIEAGRRALRDHLSRLSVIAQIDIASNTMYRVRYALSSHQPRVSIIIPFRDKAPLLRQCVSSIREKTTYKNYEIVLVDNGSVEASTVDLLDTYQDDDSISVLRQPGAFNYAALNNRAAEHSRGDYLCLLNNDTVVITPDWLEDMVGYASQPGVGCVGAKLYYANGTIQHAGVVLGLALGGVAGHAFLNRGRGDPGYFGRLQVASNYSALTGACLLVNRSIYVDVGGLDESDLIVGFNDIDFCIKVMLLGYRNVFTPFSELFHYESSSRGRDDTPKNLLRLEKERLVMKRRYGSLLDSDPYYSPHLTRTQDDFSLRAD